MQNSADPDSVSWSMGRLFFTEDFIIVLLQIYFCLKLVCQIGLIVYCDPDYLYEASGYVCLFRHELAFKHIFICDM